MAQAYVDENASLFNRCPLQGLPINDDSDKDEEKTDEFEEWKGVLTERINEFVKDAIKKHGGYATIKVTPQVIITGKEQPVQDRFLLPTLLLWNPSLNFPDHMQHLQCPKCKCGFLHQMPFENSFSTRKIYDTEEELLLVSPFYMCGRKGHVFAGSHPLILESLPSYDLIPFILFHKTGVTRTLFHFISSSVTSGSKFNEIERTTVEKYWQSHALRENAFWNAVRLYMRSNNKLEDEIVNFSFPEFKEMKTGHPSNDLITSCFLVYFVEHEVYFTDCMAQETAEEWITLDHTFKVASNIGLHNPDGRWANQFSSLMCVLNESGKVLSWKLTKGESFDKIEEMLLALKARHVSHGVNLKGACIDNCCHWRQKLQGVYGDDFIVLLDLFHAISRVTRKIPKKHNLRPDCVKDFRLVFRSATDQGDTRTEETPSKERIKTNLNLFVHKWKDAKNGKGQQVLNKKAIKECNKLQKHIDKGCVSGIPPHISTSKNERLHRTLKAQVTNCKLGVATAVAILTAVFYVHNKKDMQVCNGAVPPVLLEKNSFIISGYESPNKAPHTIERFGIGCLTPSEDSIYNSSWNKEICDTNAIATCIQSMNPNKLNSLYKKITQLFLLMKFYEEQMNVIADDCLVFENKYIPFLPTVLSVIFNDDLNNGYNSLSSSKATGLLSKNIFKPLTEDEHHCSFVEALALEMKYYGKQSIYKGYISELGFTYEMGSDEIKDILFERNHTSYVSSPVKVQEQMQVLANGVGAVFSVITNCDEFPVIPVFPEIRLPGSPLFFFHYVKGGVFVPLIVKEKISSTPVQNTRDISCTCGRSHKTPYPKCVTLDGKKYPCRCKCYLSGLACTAMCECSGCENTNGKRPHPSVTKTYKRRRYHHRSQDILDSIQKGMDFMVQNNEHLTLGTWTKSEHYLFEAVILYIKSTPGMEVTPQVIYDHFNTICNELLRCLPLPLSIGCKSELQVKSKMQVHDKTLARFQERFKQLIAKLFSSK